MIREVLTLSSIFNFELTRLVSVAFKYESGSHEIRRYAN
jgi:hypothetical protein